MNAIEVMKQIEAHGGSLHLEHDQLRVRANVPLPEELMEALSAHKPAIMIALGAPLDAAVASILTEIRPYLAPALKKLPDDRLLALVNWNLITAWGEAMRRSTDLPRKRARGAR